MIVGTKHNLAKSAGFHLHIGETSVNQSNSIKILGVTVDPGLSWSAHVSAVIKKCYSILVSLYRLRHYFTQVALKTIIQASVFSHLTYCLCVWGGANKGLLQRIRGLSMLPPALSPVVRSVSILRIHFSHLSGLGLSPW